ncbi:MAG: hypothetical protein KIC94_15420 [Clostridiales bacterium]|nr:hypothetical protein [Clostridiales bacterium]
MREKTLDFTNISYGDVCMRSSSNSVTLCDKAEYEEFEEELLTALEEVVEENN